MGEEAEKLRKEMLTERKHANAVLEEIRSNNQAIMEYVKDIPQMKDDISEIKNRVTNLETRAEATETIIKEMKPTLDATFNEVGSLRVDFEEFKHNKISL